MPRAISVVLSAVDGGSDDDWLGDVVRSLDAQTLPPQAFEVLAVVMPGSAVAARLVDLAARRPNVRVLEAGADVAAAADGEWLLDLGPDVARTRPRLLPATLQRLADAGTLAAADVVLGRTCTAGALLVEDAMLPGGPDLDADAAVALSAPAGPAPRPLVGRRTQRLREAAGDAPAQRVAAVTDACAVIDADLLAGERAWAVSGTARWSHGVLVVRAEVDLSADGDAPAGARALLGVVAGGVEHYLPTRTTAPAGGRLVAEADLDVRTAAHGEALRAGSWRVTVGVHGSAPRQTLRAAVPAVAGLGSALVGGLPVVPVPGRDLVLDVGGRATGVVGPARVEDAGVVESARGTLLRLDLPHVHAVGDARVRGALHLGTFPVPADLVVSGGAARLECWLTGLAGSSPLSAAFGGPKTSIGLTLDVDEVGRMSLRTTPPPVAPKAVAAKPAAAKRPAAPPSRALAARIRRAVPAPLEPAVRRLRRVPAARRVYRALIRRG